MSEFHKPEIFYEDNQGAIFLANNVQVGMHTKYIDICHHFLRDVVEERDMAIKYIRSKKKPSGIMTNNGFEADHATHMKIITEW